MEAAGFFVLPNYKASQFRGQQYCVFTAVRISNLKFANFFKGTAGVRCHQPASNVEKIRSLVLEPRYV